MHIKDIELYYFREPFLYGIVGETKASMFQTVLGSVGHYNN